MNIAIVPRYLDTKEGDFIIVKKKYYSFYKKYGMTLNLIPLKLNNIGNWLKEHNINLVMLAGGYAYYTKEIKKYEFEILKTALKQKLKIVGICCGMWTINALFGGNLKWNEKHEGRKYSPIHKCKVTDLLNKRQIGVNSFHRKVIDKLGKGLIPFILAYDNSVEGFYNLDKRIMAIQFHLENKGCSVGLANEFMKQVIKL